MIISRVVAPEKFAWRGETATGAIVARDADRKLRYAVRANERIMPEPPVAEVAVEGITRHGRDEVDYYVGFDIVCLCGR